MRLSPRSIYYVMPLFVLKPPGLLAHRVGTVLELVVDQINNVKNVNANP